MPLCVVIEGATNLPNLDYPISKSDPYCICEVDGQPQMRFQTRTIKNNLDPIWNHKFVLPGLSPDDELKFTVMDEDYGKDDLLGTASLSAADIAAGFTGELALIKDGKEGSGKLKVKVKVAGSDLEGSSLVLWSTWLKPNESKRHSSRISIANSAMRLLEEADGLEKDQPHAYDITEIRSPGILHPECARRLTWDVIGLFILMIDLIWLPMQVFDPPETALTMSMGWLTLLYWTGDILASCNTGFYTPEGGIVMTRRDVLIRYAKTWLFLDLPLVLVDWATIVVDALQSEVGSAGVARSAKLVRMTRIARLLRLMRLVKLRKVLFTVQSLIATEWLTLVMAVVKNLCTILAINHILACIWFWIGSSGDAGGWVAQHNLVHEDFGIQYFISLHWSLAQFTPGATPIQPHSLEERFVAVTVLAVGLVIATCFVSSITSTMASVWTANRYNSTQHLLLKKFLHQNKVSRGLGSRITHYVDFILEMRHKRVHISKVNFLSFLSGPLHIELQTELFAPTLSLHPCFNQIMMTSKPMMREICTTAVGAGTQNYAKNDMLFHLRKEAKHLLFLTLGTLEYCFKPKGSTKTQKVHVDVGSWCVEAALWMPWRHVGEMKALSEVDMVSVNCAKFREICEGNFEVFPVVRGYALNFWQEVHEHEHEFLTDVGFSLMRPEHSDKRLSGASSSTAELEHSEDMQAHLVDDWGA